MFFIPSLHLWLFYLNLYFAYNFGCILGVCLLYTSDAADERSSVDLGGRRIIKKKNSAVIRCRLLSITQYQ